MAPDTPEESAADAAGESLVVECATCSVHYPWNELAEGRRLLPLPGSFSTNESLTSSTDSTPRSIIMTDE